MVAFASAVVALLASFATVGSTIPLFNVYRAQDGFSSADVSLTVVAYSGGTLGTLLVTGRLSNYGGRRPVSIASLAFLIAGTLTRLNVHHHPVMIWTTELDLPATECAALIPNQARHIRFNFPPTDTRQRRNP